MADTGDMKSGMNMRSNYGMRENDAADKPQAKYLGIEGNREPEAHQLGSAADEGNPMSRAVKMVERHNERGEHAPMVCGMKMEDR